MRFYTVLASRPIYYDRNPTAAALSYAPGAIAPHANTQRWSYTVPSGRKAFVELAGGHVDRATAAGAAGIAQTWIQYTPNGGSVNYFLNAIIRTNAVGDQANALTGTVGMAAAGDAIAAFTGDASTTGTVNYLTSMKYTEFDA